MTTIPELITNKNALRHHALLFLSNYFSTNSLLENDLKMLVQEFCGVQNYEITNHHPDIFIADKERKILRLEDIKPLKEFSLYPPQSAKKRLFVIENCERLNVNAANSLLKILEEPPTSCLFLLTSAKLSLVLPTIASRMQKIAISFPDASQQNIKELFSADDIQWIKNQMEEFQLAEKSAQDRDSRKIAKIIARCEKLAKEYQIEDLRALLVTLINERLKADLSFINIAKLFLANLSEWKNYEGYHPATSLWLIRLFLLFS